MGIPADFEQGRVGPDFRRLTLEGWVIRGNFMPVKVLYIHGIAELGGAEMDLLSFVQGLNREEFQAIVACPAQGPLRQELQALHVPVCEVRLPAWRKLRDVLRIPKSVLALVRLIRKWQVDVVHVNDYWWAPVGWLASRICKVPCIVHIRQQIEPRRIKQYWLSKPDQLLAVSENIRSVAIDAGVKPQRIQLVYSGIHLTCQFDAVDTTSVRRQHHLKPDRPVIGSVANLFPRKGHEYLLEALVEVRKEIPDIYCFIVGEGDHRYQEKLHEIVQMRGLQRCVTFSGFQKNVMEYVAAFDVFVLPSVLEGFGIVLLEAMALKKPIVASRVGGIPEVVEDGVMGLLVPPGDPKSLARALVRLLRDPSTRFRMGQAGRQRLETYFTLEQTMAKIQGLYRSLVSPSPGIPNLD